MAGSRESFYQPQLNFPKQIFAHVDKAGHGEERMMQARWFVLSSVDLESQRKHFSTRICIKMRTILRSLNCYAAY